MAKKSNTKSTKNSKTKATKTKATKTKAVEDDAVRLKPDHTKYTKVKGNDGKTKYDIGDTTATELRLMTLDEIYKLGAKLSGIKEKDLREKYSRLNPGMQRMNLGNRIRNFVKVGEYKSLKEAIKDADAVIKAA